MRDPWHPIRFAVAVLVFFALLGLLVGLLALPWLLRWGGYRARDVWMFVVPLWNWVLLVILVWRVTAGWVYWSPRPDVRSRVLFAQRDTAPAWPTR